MTKFLVLVLGFLGHNIVKGDVAAQYTAADYNYTPSVASQSEYGSQYGANFVHAFADPKQEIFADPKQAFLAGPLLPLVASAVVGGANALYTASGLSTATSKVTANCNKLNEVLSVTTLGGTTDDSIATFAYTNGITGTSTGTAATLTLGSGGTYTSSSGLAAAAATPAALLKDVDNLRLAVAAAVLKLDTKIDEILNKATLKC